MGPLESQCQAELEVWDLLGITPNKGEKVQV